MQKLKFKGPATSVAAVAAIVAIAVAGVVLQTSTAARAEMNCSEATFCLLTESIGEATSFTAINKNPYLPLTVVLALDLDNLQVQQGTIEPFVLGGGEQRRLFSLQPQRRDDAWEYNYAYAWIEGDFTARHDDSHLYRLPYEAGQAFEVSQSCHGSFSHTGSGRFAVDFDMPSQTPVLAARSGVVVEIKQDSNRGGEDDRFENDANYVTILHADQTMGQYVHLFPNSVAVTLGQRVDAGEKIAQSGNTGFSTGPHLHFEVNVVRLGTESDREPESTSVPITFDTRGGPVTCPADGEWLRKK
jgi:murein DD-endopeptidase MepM/ murein hydrolase activator NlpD